MNTCQKLIIDNMVLKAADIFGIEPALITDANNIKKVCYARQLIWVVCVKELSIPYRTIAKEFNRNFKSVYDGVKTATDEMDVVKDKRNKYLALLETIDISMQDPVCR